MNAQIDPAFIKNNHLDGDAFYIPGGNVGVLLVHGLTATTAEVRILAEGLSQENYTVTAPLLPGHGTNPFDANRYTWQDWLEACSAALSDLRTNCDRIFVGGESTGALLGLMLAHNNQDVIGVLTYAPALRLAISPIRKLMIYLFSPFKSYYEKEGTDDGLPWKGYTVSPLNAVKQLFKLQKAVFRILPAISLPILVIQGRRDYTVNEDVPDIIKEKAHRSMVEIHWMENSSHVVAIDIEHEEVIALTKDFIRNHLERIA